MARHRSLPLLHVAHVALSPRPGSAGATPTVDAVRARLGGRASTEAGAGQLVTLTTPRGATHRGVVLFARGDDVDVWIDPPPPSDPRRAAPGGGLVRRARRADLVPLGPSAPDALAAVACDARVFGSLAEGQRIRFQDNERIGEGVLVEKCRFGALVLCDDGAVLGVGFRRLWPVTPPDAGPN